MLCDSHVMRIPLSTDYHVTHVLLLCQTRVCVCPCSEMLTKPSSFTVALPLKITVVCMWLFCMSVFYLLRVQPRFCGLSMASTK